MHEVHLDVVDSTNVYAKKHCKSFPPGKITCVTADEQTAGVGRYQRKWVSPKDVGLYATFYFTLSLNTLHLASLAQLMALSLASVLQKEGLKPEIKWPNDVRLHGKKISGILCETQFHPDHVDIFLGIGINVNLDAASAAKIDQPATSLFIETKKKWDKKEVLKKLQAQFIHDLERFKREGFGPFHKQFDQLLALKGETVRCFDGKKTWVGICHSLTEDGQLNLQLPDHTFHTLLSGDIKP
ncbi:MAG: biotin--[acetyl-CoA-carboxylase] ligase [Parachlamydiales bacterium]|nr:biotin--[acetyl-CoA-carboxylase] ligase [Parachlamydiales bacterium]